MSQQQSEQTKVVPEILDGEIDPLGLAQILGEEKWLLFGLPFLCTIFAAVFSLSLTLTYSAKATFIIPDKQSSSTAIDQFAGLGALTNNMQSSLDKYVAVLQSNVVQDVVIKELDLINQFKSKTM